MYADVHIFCVITAKLMQFHAAKRVRTIDAIFVDEAKKVSLVQVGLAKLET